MHFDAEPADEIFREGVRGFLDACLPSRFPSNQRPVASRNTDPRAVDKAEMQHWTRTLDSHGYLVPHWHTEWGGKNWRPNWRRILEDELLRAQCPQTDNIGIDFVGPVLCEFGSPEQKRRYLPTIRSGEQFWCQGFSEPQAGSDVMSLRATARPEGDAFIVNGHKLWTSHAHFADMMFALVRIETPGTRRQPGLSFLLIDMRSSGVSVKPVILIDGVRRVNEVLLENVRVPTTNLVGEIGKGWVYARYLLTKERSLMAGLSAAGHLLDRLRARAAAESRRSPLSNPLFVSRLSQLEAEFDALEFMELRFLHSKENDSAVQSLASILKLRGCELRQRLTELTMQTLGERALELPFSDDGPEPSPPGEVEAQRVDARDAIILHLYQRAATLAGGTSEIQKNMIAAISLGL